MQRFLCWDSPIHLKPVDVRVDILYQKLSAKRQALVNLFGTLVLLLPIAGLFCTRVTSMSLSLATAGRLSGAGRFAICLFAQDLDSY